MSNYYAVATVTEVLTQVLTDAVAGAVPGANAGHMSPADPEHKPPDPGVNVFLYAISPNPSLRNVDVGTRRSAGDLLQRPQAALDLHYLISFYGDQGKLEPQLLLGRVVAALHSEPSLTRQRIRDVIDNTPGLAGSDLGDALQAVRFTPEPLSLEDLSKVWSVLIQQPYVLSTAYTASAVLVEPAELPPPAPALPVAARNVYGLPFRKPIVERVADADAPDGPIAAASTLSVTGRNLAGVGVVVRLAVGDLAPSDITDNRLLAPLSSLPAGVLRAGVQGLRVVQFRQLGTPPVGHTGEESEIAAFVVHPTVLPDAGDPTKDDVVFTAATATTPATIRMGVAPVVGGDQRVSLLLNQVTPNPPPLAFSYDAPRRNSDSDHVAFDVSGIAPGTYLVRVRVEGAESPLAQDANGAFVRPQVVVP